MSDPIHSVNEAPAASPARETAPGVERHASELASEAMAQARDLAGEARAELRRHADEQAQRVLVTIRRTAAELEGMAAASPQPDGPLAEAVRQLAQAAGRAGDHLEDGGFDRVSADLGRFTREHPGAFLGAAFGAGVIGGRFLRGDLEARSHTGDSPRAEVPGPAIDLRAPAPPPAPPVEAGPLPNAFPGEPFPAGGVV